MKRIIILGGALMLVIAVVFLLGQRAQEVPTGRLFGISGYSPVGFPNPNTTAQLNYWQEINRYAEVYGIHATYTDLKLIDVAANNFKDKPLAVVTDIPAGQTWEAHAQQLTNVLADYLAKYPQIKYLSIGNEINFSRTNEQINDFVLNYPGIYDTLKGKYPNTQIYTTFQYESLIGKAQVTGTKQPNRISLLQELEPKLDLIAVTTYPFFDYASPNELTADYYSQITSVSNKKIAITETGWPVRSQFPNQFSNLVRNGLGGSEAEQLDYLQWVINLPSEKFEYINWIFLNDFSDFENTDTQVATEHLLFDSVGLRYNSGKPKPAFELWISLFTN